MTFDKPYSRCSEQLDDQGHSHTLESEHSTGCGASCGRTYVNSKLDRNNLERESGDEINMFMAPVHYRLNGPRFDLLKRDSEAIRCVLGGTDEGMEVIKGLENNYFVYAGLNATPERAVRRAKEVGISIHLSELEKVDTWNQLNDTLGYK